MPNLQYLRIICRLSVLFVTLELTNTPLLAQTLIPDQIPILPQRPQIPLELAPKKEPILKSPSPFPLQPENSNENPKIIKVKRFVFKGNTVFSDKQLEEVVAPYINREIIFSNLLKARAAITKLYVDRGYITSGAYLAVTENQAVQALAAVITIEIVEGKVQGINVSGGSRLRPYIRSRLRAATSPILNSDRLIEALRLLQIDPLVETVSAELSQGSEIGTTILNVKVKARQPFRVEAALDNSRSPAVGSFERRVLITDTNVIGLGDILSVGYRNTDGSDAVETGYSLPINHKNGTVQLSYINISSRIIEKPFSRLDILDNARVYDLSFRQPLLQRASAKSTQEFALGLTASRLESEASLLQTPYPLSEGADNRGRTKYQQSGSLKSGQKEVFERCFLHVRNLIWVLELLMPQSTILVLTVDFFIGGVRLYGQSIWETNLYWYEQTYSLLIWP